MHEYFCRVLSAALLPFAFAPAAFAQMAATRTNLLSFSNPSTAGASVMLRAEVDAAGGGAPTGWVSFWDGATRIGDAKLGPAAGAGQETLAAGVYHHCALSSVGGVKCWGNNGRGQLGDGTRTQRNTPVDVAGLASGVASLAGGYNHSCAVTSASGLKCWGRNDYGQLGDSSYTTRFKPVDVAGLTSGAVSVAAGYFHTCALSGAGGVKCWGDNQGGKLGDGTTVLKRSVPGDVVGLTRGVVAIALGYAHTCALTSAGGVKCWGLNTNGQLGDGTRSTRTMPVDVSGLTAGVVAIAAGSQHSCALTTAGSVKCWGDNYYGQLGDGTTTAHATPVDVSGLTGGVRAVSLGHDHSCALTGAGGAKCWGNNGKGQLGYGAVSRRLRPVDVSGLSSGAAAIAAGYEHTCATRAGGAQCWGRNDYGQLGDGTTTNRVTPVPTLNLTPLIRARTSFVTPPLASGPHWLRAFYRGDAAHETSLGGVRQQIE